MTGNKTMFEKTIYFALGGSRSGKSDHAEEQALMLADKHGLSAFYIATGQAFDDEMKARIERHQSRRSSQFTTIEAPLDLVKSLMEREAGDIVMVDSIGTWITNHMMADANIDEVIDEAITALEKTPASVVLVSDEIGMGIIPDNTMSRQFRDHIGMMNQRVAGIANTVVFMVAGLPLTVKS